MKWCIRDAELRDVHAIAEHLRPADKVEIRAMHGGFVTPLAVLAASRMQSDWCRVGEIKGVPTVIYGVCRMPTRAGVGVPWMFGTSALEDPAVARRFLRGCAGEVEDMQAAYPLLVNYVDARNTLAIRWLGWLGFKFINEAPQGAEQRPFIEFVRIRDVLPNSSGDK